jgi:hypothetical protein
MGRCRTLVSACAGGRSSRLPSSETREATGGGARSKIAAVAGNAWEANHTPSDNRTGSTKPACDWHASFHIRNKILSSITTGQVNSIKYNSLKFMYAGLIVNYIINLIGLLLSYNNRVRGNCSFILPPI